MATAPSALFGARLVREVEGIGAIDWLDATAHHLAARVGPRTFVLPTDTFEPRLLCSTRGATRARFSDDGTRLVVLDRTDQRARGSVWDVRHATCIARRELAPTVRDAAPLGDRVVLAVTEPGLCAIRFSGDLEWQVDELLGERGARHVDARADVVVVSGPSLHVWWPDRRRQATRLGEIWSLDVGACALSRDGRTIAFCARPRADDDVTDTYALTTASPDARPVAFDARALRTALPPARHVAVSADGALAAVSSPKSSHVRIHDTSDGALIGAIEHEAQRALAWLDATRLATAGDTLAIWHVTPARMHEGAYR